MSADVAVRTLVWDSLLSADLNQRYSDQLAGRYQRIDRWGKFVVAALSSSSALASWAIWGKPGMEWAWPVMSGAAAIVALALPIFDPAKSMKTASALAGGWFGVFKEYELLWAQIGDLSDAKAHAACKTIGDEEKRLSGLEAPPMNRALARRCEEEVRAYYAALESRTGG
jgi:hypothetical protein